MNRVKGVPRNLDSESRLWEAIEKLSDLSVMQMAQIDLLTKGQGRFKHKNDSKEAKLIEENMLSLKKREAAELTKRRQEFEHLIDSHSVTMQNVRTSLLEEQTAHKETADMLQDEQLQRKHASDNYKEVQSWLEDAKKRIKELSDEVHGHELAKAALDDNTQDMQTTIGNLQNGITAREERIKIEELKSSRVQEELDEVNAVIQKKDDANNRLKDDLDANDTENQAEQSRLYSEIAHLKTEIDVIMENTKRWENFEKLCPDYKELVSQLETKDEIIHRTKQAIATMNAEERSHEKESLDKEAATMTRIATLKSIENSLDNIVTENDTGVGNVCVEKTLVCCYPDPCPVGRELHLLLTTCDSTGLPIRGVHQSEFKVQRLTMPPTGGCQIGDDIFVEDVLDNGRISSTFHSSYGTNAEGRSGYKVTFRGQTFLTSANVPAACPTMSDANEAESLRKPVFTVHCSPSTVAVGEELDVTICMREEGSWLPAKMCTTPVDQFRISPYSTASGIRLVNPLKQVNGVSVYTMTIPIDDIHAAGTPRDYVGLEVMIQGGTDAARGSSKLVADSRHDTEWDPTSTLISCSPDPATVGDEITVVVTPRNSYWVPLPKSSTAAPTPQITPLGSATLIHQPQEVQGYSQVYAAKFIPSNTGRCGVSVTMGGLDIGCASVQVNPADRPDPENTLLEIDPPVVPAGEPLHVTIVTKDASGRRVPGPEPTAFRLTPLSASTKIFPLRRVEGDDCRYVSTIETDVNSSYTTAGVAVDFDGASLSKKIRVGREGPDMPVHNTPSASVIDTVPKYSVAFGGETAAPSAVLPVIISVNQDDPATDRRRANIRPPVVRPVLNCEVSKPVVALAGARYVWKCYIRLGNVLGTASIEVDMEGHTYTASTTVAADVTKEFDGQVDRLKEMEIKIRDLVRATEEKQRDLEEKERQLADREELLREKEEEREQQNSALLEEEQPQHLLFGVQLSDGVQYGSQWEPVDGAKVVDVLEGGPLDSGTEGQKVQPGDILKEVQWEDVYGYIHTCAVRQMDDFKRICRMLSRQGFAPVVTLTFFTVAQRSLKIVVEPGTTPEPPGRSMGTRRHPSRSVDASICSSPPPGISPARSTA
eukprot:TRINITY_DN3829_c0_g1_i2.p1 TRINITY_DN3829_c0_g1~~TRINITY_DN3829_c0_g1_i2.p1  ORF type:complete len:1108 (+),score=277.47 TRINITY_DN3829_c0_g1_i2:887-4210(+)